MPKKAVSKKAPSKGKSASKKAPSLAFLIKAMGAPQLGPPPPGPGGMPMGMGPGGPVGRPRRAVPRTTITVIARKPRPGMGPAGPVGPMRRRRRVGY